MQDQIQHCGYVAIVGRPNVGKSTLLNHILGMKLSITSRKPQTTRHQILGVKTTGASQAIYVDTPGIHKRRGTAINRYMNRAATSVLADVDVVLFVIQAGSWQEEDQNVLERLESVTVPVILVVNKIDTVQEQEKLLDFVQQTAAKYAFEAVVPTAALKNSGIDQIEQCVAKLLPENPPFFPEDQLTDRSTRFLVTEIIREKLVRELGQELPYTSTVMIEKYVEENNMVKIHAVIYVETKGQKAIIIGRKGERLKSIGTSARKSIESLIDSKVYLNLWVKIREGWSNDERALRSLGYDSDS
ncbi:MAG: GTPase Era [Gammaproteobacteria bacterium]